MKPLLVVIFVLLCTAQVKRAIADEQLPAEDPFAARVAPLLSMYCLNCHNDEQHEGDLSLTAFADRAAMQQNTQQFTVQQNYVLWQKVQKMLAERQMPPESEEQPSEAERQLAIEVLDSELAKFDCTQQEKSPGRVTLRRLNRAEYTNTIRDLLGISFAAAADFPSDEVGHGFDNIGDVLSLPPILLEKYLAAAEQAVGLAFTDPQARQRIFVHQPSESVNRIEAARQNLRDFVSRAYRRPAADDEVNRLLDLIRRAIDEGSDEQQAFQAAMQAVLCSPHFLFRIELDDREADRDADGDGIRALNDFEIASRLSYFLWSSMPDEELFALAGDSRLHDKDVLRQQVERMLRDPKSQALVANFAGQWLQLRDVAMMTPDPQRFPGFDEPLRMAMQRETELFFETVMHEDRSILDFLNADFTFVNERLARHYGIEGVVGEQFQRVPLPAQRRGILTQGSILLITSNPTRTSPVKRGKWILENILGEPPPPPPPNIEELKEEGELLGTLRERMEQHRMQESCAVCHRTMDALGFGLENFDAVGAWRDNDGQFAVDSSGVLPGDLQFQGPKELMEILGDHKRTDFCRCLAQKMLTYAIGRGLTPNDACAVDQILKQLAENDYRFSSLVTGIVISDPFLLRQVKEE